MVKSNVLFLFDQRGIFLSYKLLWTGGGAKWWHSPVRLRATFLRARNIVDSEYVKTQHCSFRTVTGVHLIELDRLP